VDALFAASDGEDAGSAKLTASSRPAAGTCGQTPCGAPPLKRIAACASVEMPSAACNLRLEANDSSRRVNAAMRRTATGFSMRAGLGANAEHRSADA
jgi:hypothetical protein